MNILDVMLFMVYTPVLDVYVPTPFVSIASKKEK
jgi:hypothetical protein